MSGAPLRRVADTAQWMDVAMRPDRYAAPVQRKAARESEGQELPADGAGKAMPEAVRGSMETAFGHDFEGVRIHEGPRAEALGARAFTRGQDVHFAPGEYQPESRAGQELLGHELAHVVQQSEGRVNATTQAKGVGINDDAGLEREADEMGRRAARGDAVAGSEPGRSHDRSAVHTSAAGGAGAVSQRMWSGLKFEEEPDDDEMDEKESKDDDQQDEESDDDEVEAGVYGTLAVQVQMNGKTVEHVAIRGRPPSPFGSGTQGSHLVAWCVKEQGLAAQLRGKSLKRAFKILDTIFKSESGSHGKKSLGSLPKLHLDSLEKAKKNASELLGGPQTPLTLQQSIASCLTYINYLPLATVDVGGVPGGLSESRYIPVLHQAESGQKVKTEKLMVAMLSLYDSTALSNALDTNQGKGKDFDREMNPTPGMAPNLANAKNAYKAFAHAMSLYFPNCWKQVEDEIKSEFEARYQVGDDEDYVPSDDDMEMEERPPWKERQKKARVKPIPRTARDSMAVMLQLGEDGVITSLTVAGRPPGPFSSASKHGDHTTAWSVLVEEVRRSLVNAECEDAQAAMAYFVLAIESLPGYKARNWLSSDHEKRFAEANKRLKQTFFAAEPEDPVHLQELIHAYLCVRNLVPLTTFESEGKDKGKGKGEGEALGKARAFEEDPTCGVDPAEAIVKLLDIKTVLLQAARQGSPEKEETFRATCIAQHIATMTSTFPKTLQASKLDEPEAWKAVIDNVLENDTLLLARITPLPDDDDF